MNDSPQMRATAADIVSTALVEMAPTASDVGDVLSGGLAGVIACWLHGLAMDRIEMRNLFHKIADQHFDNLSQLIPARDAA